MTEHKQIPLVGPARRRSWRQVIWLRPLVSSAQSAIVATRRGRLVSVLPANGARVFSDYLTLPYTFREVDMRERQLVVEQRLESCDAGYEFEVALRLTYQVARPERVALERDEPLADLERAVIQNARQIARAFGVEQAKALEDHLEEVVTSGDAMLQRVEALGLALRRVDAIVTLGERARAHAEQLSAHTHERPLHAQISIGSLDPERSFAVQVGGFYRMTSRTPAGSPALGIESAIQQAIARALQRVGITFAPPDYQAAAKAMTDMLRQDPLLQAELLVIHTQLLRPAVEIQPDRSMVPAPPAHPPAAPDPRPEPPVRRSRQGLIRPEHGAGVATSDDTPPWSDLAAASGREPLASTEASEADRSLAVGRLDRFVGVPPSLETSAAEAVQASPRRLPAARLGRALPRSPGPEETVSPLSDPQADAEAPILRAATGDVTEPAPLASHDDPRPEGLSLDHDLQSAQADLALGDDALDVDLPQAQTEDARLLSEEPTAHDPQVPIESGDVSTEMEVDHTQIERFLALLHEHRGPAWFKMCSLELIEAPDRLAAIMAEVTADPDLLAAAAKIQVQQALAHALRANPPVDMIAITARPMTAPLDPPAAEPDDEQNDIPDWLRLHQKWGGDGGGR